MEYQKILRVPSSSVFSCFITYPKFGIKILQSLHVHPWGFQFEMEFLKDARDLLFFISSGTRSHIKGPLYRIVSLPYFSVRTLGIIQSEACLVLVLGKDFTNKSCTGTGEILFFTLYISTANF